MKATGASLKAHMAGTMLTLATLWRVTRRDAAVYGFTDHDQDITYSGTTFLAASGMTPTAVKSSAGLQVDNLDVQALLDSSTITDADLLAGRWDYATVEIWRLNWADTSMGHEVIRKGTIGNVHTGRSAFTAELRGMTQPLQQAIGRTYTPACDADFGDARCGKSLASYTVTGTLSSVTDQRQFSDSGRGESADYFRYGLLTWTSGANNGLSMEVKSFASGMFTLQEAMVGTVAVGDTYSVYAGCDKRLATCRDTYSNVVNFRGFPHVPGNDKMMSGK
jgi:uncharacterized phage protein (TIGR02218 family)